MLRKGCLGGGGVGDVDVSLELYEAAPQKNKQCGKVKINRLVGKQPGFVQNCFQTLLIHIRSIYTIREMCEAATRFRVEQKKKEKKKQIREVVRTSALDEEPPCLMVGGVFKTPPI